MRLKRSEIEAIKEVVALFDKEAKVYLFGSRVDDNKRGGDIDLLIESEKIGLKEIVKIKTKLMLRLGERSIDIVLKQSNPFVKHVEKTAIEL